ncbi:MAG: hypothetical protein HRT36_00495 [Alphaproteobacteria bacterium]|nr:hypothetical protein [Alphaproteobacteria bacterium]
MSEANNHENLDQEKAATISVVCDHCSTGYHVPPQIFKDSFKHQFHCPNCDQDWVEYLDIPIWEEIRDVVQKFEHIEQAKQKKLYKEAEKFAAKEEAAREAEEFVAKEEAAREAEKFAAKEEAARETEKTAEAAAAKDTPKSKKNSKNAKTKSAGAVGKVLVLINPAQWRQFSLVPLVASLIVIVAIYLGSAGYFYANRASIVEANPLATGLYNAMGIAVSSVDGLGVKIENLERKDIVIPGERTQFEFSLRAKVRNFSETEKRLPYLRVSALNLEGDDLAFWDVNLIDRVLKPDQEINVTTAIPGSLVGDERVESIVARLISKEEREYLGIGEEVENLAATF